MQQFYSIIDVSETERWNKALENVPHSFAHTAEHCKAVHIDTGHRTFLYLFEKDDVKICCPLMERDFNGSKDIAKPFGISGFTGNGTHPDFYRTWRSFIERKGYISGYLGIHPLYGKKDWFPAENIYPHNTVQVLDIRPEADTILANMSSGRRRQLSKWSEIRYNLTSNRYDIQHFFLNHYQDFLDSKQAASYYYFSDISMKSFFNAERSIIVGAVEDNKVVSAAFFGYTDFLADYLFIFSLPNKNYHTAHLIWYSILELKEIGVPLLNLGGGGQGISEFKRRFGAYERPMFSVKEVYEETTYTQLIGNKSADVRNHEGYFPLYRK
jgi:hypothetical protein